MNVFEKLEERATGMRRPDEFERKPIEIEQECVLTGADRPSTYAMQYQHELRLRVFARFWCNQAEYSGARKQATHLVADCLYRDVLVELTGIMSAIQDGDRSAALKRCAELMDALRS